MDHELRPTFYRICKNRSTEGFQVVPYVVALFSAMLMIYYALIKTHSILLLTINGAGCVIETLYITLFLAFGCRKAKASLSLSLSLSLSIYLSLPHQSFFPSFYLSIYLFIYLSPYLSLYVSIFSLSFYLSLSLSHSIV